MQWSHSLTTESVVYYLTSHASISSSVKWVRLSRAPPSEGVRDAWLHARHKGHSCRPPLTLTRSRGLGGAHTPGSSPSPSHFHLPQGGTIHVLLLVHPPNPGAPPANAEPRRGAGPAGGGAAVCGQQLGPRSLSDRV